MNTRILNAAALSEFEPLVIGRQAENNYRQFTFNCAGFGNVASVTLVHQRCEDVAPYIVASANGAAVTWTVTNIDTAYAGKGKAELRMTFADGLAKSVTIRTEVIASITGDTVIPAPLQSWYDAMIDYINEHSVTDDQLEQAIEDYMETHPISAPVTSVNAKTGAVVLTASDVGALPDSVTIPTKTSQLQNDSGYITAAPVDSVNGQTGTVVLPIPTKTSDLVNDSGFISSVPVSSVNNKTGAVTLTASDVGALPNSTAIPSKTSDLVNDSGFLSSAVTTFNGQSGAVTYTAPVSSVNGQTGAVTISAATTSAAGLMSATDKSHLDDVYADYSSALTALGVI